MSGPPQRPPQQLGPEYERPPVPYRRPATVPAPTWEDQSWFGAEPPAEPDQPAPADPPPGPAAGRSPAPFPTPEPPAGLPVPVPAPPLPVPIARPDLPPAEREPADRPSPAGSIGAAVLALAVAGGVAVAARSGRVELLGALAVVQALLIGLWLRLLRPPGPTVVGVLAGGLAVAADLLLYRQQTAELRTLAAVVAVAFPLALAGQLVRGVTREDVTAALAATMSLGVSMALIAGLLVAARLPGGRNVLVVAAAALGTAIAVARVVDLFVPGPRFAPTVARGVPGLAAGALAGTGAGVAAAQVGGKISVMSGLGVGIAVAAVAVLADLAAGYLLVDRDGNRLGFALGPLLASAYAVAPAYALGWILLN